MSKALLLPEDTSTLCSECYLGYDYVGYDYTSSSKGLYCVGAQELIDNLDENMGHPNWCPLQSVPDFILNQEVYYVFYNTVYTGKIDKICIEKDRVQYTCNNIVFDSNNLYSSYEEALDKLETQL